MRSFLQTAWSKPGVSRRWLNLHESDSKALMDRFGVRTQRWKLADTPEAGLSAATALQAETGCDELVVKAMVLAGGRGKGHFDTGFKGGVHLTTSPERVKELCQEMLGHNLITKQTPPEGVPVRKVMLAESIVLEKELYFAILMDRESMGPVLVGSPQGGMDIEQVAETNPEAIFKEPIDIFTGPTAEQAERMARNLGFSDSETVTQCADQIKRLYDLFIALDATQVEVNPLAVTPDRLLYCVDAKMNFDDNAAYRQKDVYALRDTTEEDPREVAADEAGLNYVGLDGNIGCMVNGAGLAMATMDVIKLNGGEPANFLDVGGTVTEDQVTEAFRIITSDARVKALLVNIFGGIVKCDVIARGVIAAARNIDLKVPLVVRLAGTNVETAKDLLAESGLPIITAEDLDDAASKVCAFV